MTIRGLTLTGGDVSGEGGAIHARETLIVNDSTISENSAGGSGGGIWAHGDVMVTSSTISANSANSAPGTYPYGGGIWGRTVNVTSSTISGNSANGSGGGIYARDVVISLSTISGNSAFRGGGIIGAYVTVVTSSTITGNGAEFIGGGIHAGSFVGTVVTIENSIVAGNTDNGSARSAPDVDLSLGPLGLLSIEYSFVGDNTGTGLTEAPVGAPDANGNLIGGAVEWHHQPAARPTGR